jgi:hypothetical protein
MSRRDLSFAISRHQKTMIEVEVKIPAHALSAAIPRIVEQVCATEGLTLSLKGTLAKYPGSIHWHFKKGLAPGTLEITWWEKQKRLWFKVAAGRRGAWIDDSIVRMKEQIEQALLKRQD